MKNSLCIRNSVTNTIRTYTHVMGVEMINEFIETNNAWRKENSIAGSLCPRKKKQILTKILSYISGNLAATMSNRVELMDVYFWHTFSFYISHSFNHVPKFWSHDISHVQSACFRINV